MSSLGALKKSVAAGGRTVNLDAAAIFRRQRNPFGDSLFPDVSAYYCPLRSESANREIRVVDVTPQDALKDRLHGMMTGIGLGQVYDSFPMRTVILYDVGRNEVIMATNQHERRTNAEFLLRAHGNVLVGGAGLGMVLLAAEQRPEVRSITCIEIDPEIRELVSSRLPLKKTTLVHGDIFEWTPPAGTLYDVAYFDVWNHPDAPGVYDEIRRLRERFRPYLNRENPEAWIGAWEEVAAWVSSLNHAGAGR